LIKKEEGEIRQQRQLLKITPIYKMVDTCAAEFQAATPYYYSTYETENEVLSSDQDRVIVLGGGPNRIGQGIEFDYCCVHAAMAIKELGLTSIMINCNPETVSTDYDISDKLYFEPLTLEDVLAVVDMEKPRGVIVQFGGQTPLNLALSLKKERVPILGTSPENIDIAEDRKKFQILLNKLKLRQPENGTATSLEEAYRIAQRITYPVIVRPSYVLGGRAMEIVRHPDEMKHYMEHAFQASPEHPVLIDKFLDEAIEVDVDAISDGREVTIGGIMEHVEAAGIHSGDSACALPPFSLKKKIVDEIRRQTRRIALELKTVGLINIQYAVKEEIVYILEVNPRASRTVPFISKVIGVPLAKLATKVMLGKTLKELKFTQEVKIRHTAVKEAVFSFSKFPGVDTILGPEMKSTGEVMGIDRDFHLAYSKAQIAAGNRLPRSGNVFISVRDADKSQIVPVALDFLKAGFKLYATSGTASVIESHKIPVNKVFKISEGRPHPVDLIINGDVDFVVNTTDDRQTIKESFPIRRAALQQNVPYVTTLSGAQAAVGAILAEKKGRFAVRPLQYYFAIPNGYHK